MEETISLELELYRLHLDLGLNTIQDEEGDELAEGHYHHNYWGEEGEIIFAD